MKIDKKMGVVFIAMLGITAGINNYAAEALSSPVVDVLIKSDSEDGVIKKFPVDKAFGDIVRDNRHYPFINIKLMQEQHVIEHKFDKNKQQTEVSLTLMPAANFAEFKDFINQYSSYSFINLVNDKGENIGCLKISDYQKLVNIG